MPANPLYLQVDQGSDHWFQARLGVATASQFKRIITPAGNLSAMRKRYRAELVCEWVSKEPYQQFESEDMARGKLLEPEAFKAYALMRDIQPISVGFIYRDPSKMVGCSPDAVVGAGGLLEMKAPMLKQHLVYLDEGGPPADYFCQYQGQLWCSGRAWVDFFSYHPGYPHLLIRILPDPAYQRALDLHMPAFLSELLSGRQRMIDLGVPITETYTPRPLPGESEDLVPRNPRDYMNVG